MAKSAVVMYRATTCLLIGSAILFCAWCFTDRSETVRVRVTTNSSHFTVSIFGQNLKSRASDIVITVKTSIAEFTVSVDELPNAVVTDQLVIVTLFSPVNGVSTVTVQLKKSKLFESNIDVSEFPTDSTYTRLFCIGKSYRSRWCYGRNVCVDQHNLYFVLPYEAHFNDIFLVPGFRAPPNDPQRFRITKDRIAVSTEPFGEYKNITGVIGSRFYNSRMLWHCTMDSLFPTYWTMTSYTSNITDSDWGHEENPNYGIEFDNTSEIVVFDDFGSTALYFLRALSDRPPVLIGRARKCYRNVILGLRKSSKNAESKDEHSLTMRYDIDPQGVRGLRRVMLEWANTSEENCVPSKENPYILVIHRRGTEEKRRIINADELINATKEMCPKCNVSEVDLQTFDKKGQVRAVCKASALIGAHGSGLTHVAWLRPTTNNHPTTLIELFPYKYTCRDWYEQEANTSRVGYIAIHTLHLNQSRWESWHNKDKVARCHTLEGECLRGRCHDFLRDQSMIVDIQQYKSLTRQFFQTLQA